MINHRRELRAAATAAAVLFGLALPAAPAAVAAISPGAQGAEALSPLLAKLAEPAVAARGPASQAGLVGVPAGGPGSLQREGERVLVSVRFEQGALDRLSALRNAGARVLDASRGYQTVTLSATPSQLDGLARVPGVAWVGPVRTPLIFGATAAASASSCEGGSVVSEGVQQLRVDMAREGFGLRGKGITVGVLSDSFDRAAGSIRASQDVGSNDLPGPASTCGDEQLPVRVIEEGSGGDDEGRAMLQIVHDVAPHAQLAFATAFAGELAFAQNIERLARPVSAGGAGADVIADDVAYFEEPFFQDGPVADAVRKVSAEGVTYLSAAGNDNLFDHEGHEMASWEAPEFRDVGCPVAVGPTAVDCMDFDPGIGTDSEFGIVVEPGETLDLDLQWAEPWNGVKADLDAYLLDAGGTEVLASSTEDNLSQQRPVEILSWKNAGPSPKAVQLAVNRCFGPCNPGASPLAKPRLKLVLLENGEGVEATEYPVSSGGDTVGPTIFGHAGTPAALAVGAVRYSNSFAPEPYSSRGPVTHYFGPVAGSQAASPLPAPEVIQKPDLVATDCGATTFFSTLREGVWRFCGTSAAAPHAAGVAALLAQGKPGISPQEAGAAMTASAAPVGGYPPQAVGAGLLRADAAMTLLGIVPSGEDGGSATLSPLSPHVSGQATQPLTPASSPASAVPPSTRIARHPPKRVRIAGRQVRLVFVFASNQAKVDFLCRVDHGVFRRCPARFGRRYRIGRHVLRVKARGASGLVDPTPARYRFRVAGAG